MAHKGEPFVSGIGNSAEAVAALMDGISRSAAVAVAAAELLPGAQPAPAASTAPAEGSSGAPAAAGAPADEVAAPAPVPAAAEPPFRAAKSFKLLQFLSPRDMVAAQLPHLQWSDTLPPILSFYSFAAFEVA